MTINDCMAALVAELAEGEVPDALAQRFCLSSVWADLARLAGEPLPAEVAAVVADVLDATCEPLPVLPPFARANFADAWLPLERSQVGRSRSSRFAFSREPHPTPLVPSGAGGVSLSPIPASRTPPRLPRRTTATPCATRRVWGPFDHATAGKPRMVKRPA